MKKIFFILLAFVAITFVATSCSDDDEKDPNEFFYGEWRQLKSRITYFVFNADGTYECNYPLPASGTYTLVGTKLTLDGGFTENVVFSQDKKQMQLYSFTWVKQ